MVHDSLLLTLHFLSMSSRACWAKTTPQRGGLTLGSRM